MDCVEQNKNPPRGGACLPLTLPNLHQTSGWWLLWWRFNWQGKPLTEECLEFTPFGPVFRRERDALSRFFESLQRTKVKIRCCTILQVHVQWLAGVCMVCFYYFLTKLRTSNEQKTAFIEGGKLALVKEPFLCTITANYRRVELLFHVTYE